MRKLYSFYPSIGILIVLLLLPSCDTGTYGELSKPQPTSISNEKDSKKLFTSTPSETAETAENTESPEPARSPEASASSNPSINEDKSNRTVEIDFVGDVMMDYHIGDAIAKYGVDYPWTDAAPLLSKADLAVANLETSVSTRGTTKKPKGYDFRSAPSTLEGLKNSGIDMVSLANNHVLDFGADALADTIQSLDLYDIHHAGAGSTRKDAEQLSVIERNGLKVGFLSYAAIVPDKSWIATEDSPGLAPLKREYYDSILKHIDDSDKQCDILIVLLHWGIEHSSQVEEWQRELAKKMIDHGADAVIGHHPHVLRAIEFYHNKPIVYSTGNFVFLKRNELAAQTAIFAIKFNIRGFVHGSVQPFYIQGNKANLLEPSSGLSKQIINQMKELSKPLGTEVTDAGEFYPVHAG